MGDELPSIDFPANLTHVLVFSSDRDLLAEYSPFFRDVKFTAVTTLGQYLEALTHGDPPHVVVVDQLTPYSARIRIVLDQFQDFHPPIPGIMLVDRRDAVTQLPLADIRIVAIKPIDGHTLRRLVVLAVTGER